MANPPTFTRFTKFALAAAGVFVISVSIHVSSGSGSTTETWFQGSFENHPTSTYYAPPQRHFDGALAELRKLCIPSPPPVAEPQPNVGAIRRLSAVACAAQPLRRQLVADRAKPSRNRPKPFAERA